MYREILYDLCKWKNKPDSIRSPLILQGAKQVGKTWVLKEFGKTKFENYIYINFENSNELYHIFKKISNPHKILECLSIFSEQDIIPGKTLIIFDEIQNAPYILTALKYFKDEASEYHICCAGSLFELHSNLRTLIPVGKVEFLDIYPMSFKEFIIANGFGRYINYLENLTIKDLKCFYNIHDLKHLLRIYFYIGGMPKPVQTWLDTKNFVKVQTEFHNIIQIYLNDFAKYSNTNIYSKVTQVWYSVINENNSDFSLNVMSSDKNYKTVIQRLIDSHYLIKVNSLEDNTELNLFKLYCLDIGLLAYLSGFDTKLILTSNKLFTECNAILTEQFIVQELRVYSKAFYQVENSSEVVFILQHYDDNIPIEVKTCTGDKIESLNCNEKYKYKVGVKVSLRNFDYNFGVINLPLYIFWLLPNLLEKITKV